MHRTHRSRRPFGFALALALALTMPGARAADSGSPPTWSKVGNVELKSVGPLAFAPEGVLLVADPLAATIVAIATGDVQSAAASTSAALRIEGVDQKVAALLGTAPDAVLIVDMAVNPLSRNVYLAVTRGRGPDATAVIVRARPDGRLEEVALTAVHHAKVQLPDPPAEAPAGGDNRQRNPRLESITDIAFLQDRVLVAGLSNEEFASTLRSIPFPFTATAKGASVEIYHGAHGRFETRSPVRTFVPFQIGPTPHLLAAYTCTPLVQFPLADLQPGSKVKGKTIAELGNRNRPLDMIVYQKAGKDYLLLANNSRGIMKIPTDRIEATDPITQPVPDGKTQGLAYETVAEWNGIDQLDRLDPAHAVVVRRTPTGAMNLEALPLP